MTNAFAFGQLYPWALMPAERGTQVEKPKRDLFDDFRYFRQNRRRENCWPWRVANQLGWDVCSPVDVTVEPLSDIELTASLSQEEILSIAGAANLTELWRRGDSHVAFPSSSWLRLYDFRHNDGWRPMFTPNGQGSVEWSLGWSLDVPTDMAILVMRPDRELSGVEVPMGVITSRKAQDFTGFSIAIEIRARTTLRRGDVVARLLPISMASLKSTATYSYLEENLHSD